MGAVWAEIRAGGLRFWMLTTVEGVAMSSHLLEQSKEATILETVLVLRRHRKSVPYLTRKNALQYCATRTVSRYYVSSGFYTTYTQTEGGDKAEAEAQSGKRVVLYVVLLLLL